MRPDDAQNIHGQSGPNAQVLLGDIFDGPEVVVECAHPADVASRVEVVTHGDCARLVGPQRVQLRFEASSPVVVLRWISSPPRFQGVDRYGVSVIDRR